MSTLEAVEERWGQSIMQALEAGYIDRGNGTVEYISADAVVLLRQSPHLWPYFLFPGGQGFVPPEGIRHTHHVDVRVYRGLWVTDCPFCTSAQHAARHDRWFFCASCKNTNGEHKSVPVVWPERVDEIERLLLKRPFWENRNWFPHENPDDLARENREHGVT